MQETLSTEHGVQLPLAGVSVTLGVTESTPVGEAAPKSSLLTAEELALHLGCSVRQVWKMSAERVIPSVRYGRWVRFDPAACLEALTRKAGN